MALTKVTYSMINSASVNVEDFGASVSASAATNYQALVDAIAYVCDNNGGEVYLPYLYDIGNNIVTIENGSLPLGASLTIRGRSMGNIDFRPDVNASGIKSSATTILRFNIANPFTRNLILKDLRFQGEPNVTVFGLDFANGAQNVNVTLQNVHVSNMEGPTAICIRTGDAVDTAWSNVNVTGVNTQPNVGIYVSRESPPIVGGAIKYCRRAVQIGPVPTAYARMVNMWMLVLAETGVYMEQPSGAFRNNPSSFINCFIGESSIDSVQIFYGETGGNVAHFTNCIFDRPAAATKPGVEMLGAGTLNFIDCTLSFGASSGQPDISAASSRVVLIGCGSFGQDIITGLAQGRSASIRAAADNQALELVNGTGLPVLGFRRSTQTVRNAGIGYPSGSDNICFGGTTSGIRCTATGVIPALVSDVGIASTNDTLTLGVAGARWTEVFATNGTINTSDERQKQDIALLDDAEKRVAIALKGLVKKFRFKSAVEKKGDDARIHVGVIAQEVKTAFEAEGLDAHRYGIFCYDEWDAEYDAEGKEIQAAGNAYGVRYEELLAFIIAAI
jgi:hypothetical protein